MTAKFSLVSVAALAALPLPLACGGDDGPTHVTTHDAPPMNVIDAPAPCLAADTYTPTFGSDDQFADDYPSTGSGSQTTRHVMFYTGYLNDEATPDALWIDLWQGYGAFAGSDIHTGTFTISGDDAKYSTCGVCAYIAADLDADNTPADYYFAASGIVNITSITTRLTGTITNLVLPRVGIDTESGDPADSAVGDCQSRIVSGSFDIPITIGSAATGKGPIRVKLNAPRVLHHRYQ